MEQQQLCMGCMEDKGTASVCPAGRTFPCAMQSQKGKSPVAMIIGIGAAAIALIVFVTVMSVVVRNFSKKSADSSKYHSAIVQNSSGQVPSQVQPISPSGARAENFLMTSALNSEGNFTDKVTSYSPVVAKLYIAGTIMDAPSNTKVTFKWTYLTENQAMGSSNVTMEGSRYVNSWFERSTSSFSEGDYEVRVLVDNVKVPVALLRFTISAASPNIGVPTLTAANYVEEANRKYTYFMNYPNGTSGDFDVVTAKLNNTLLFTQAELVPNSDNIYVSHGILKSDGVYIVPDLEPANASLYLPNAITEGFTWKTQTETCKIMKTGISCEANGVKYDNCLIIEKNNIVTKHLIYVYLAPGMGEVLGKSSIDSTKAVYYLKKMVPLTPDEAAAIVSKYSKNQNQVK